MDRYLKFFKSLKNSEQTAVIRAWEKILLDELDGLEVKKLREFKNLYRVRTGKIRLVFEKSGGKNRLVNIDYRKGVYKRLK